MRNFILGTDWWTDCDDAVAIRLLCRASLQGKIDLKGVGINACMPNSVAAMDAFLTHEGMGHLPIGIDLEASDFHGKPFYQNALAPLAARYHKNEDAEDSVQLYRRIIAEADAPVEIVEIGFLQVIANVLLSGPDDISEKTGMELVREKVRKIWVMAGKWDADGEKEHNFENNARSRHAGEVFCRICPVPVTFLGWEISYDVITGKELRGGDMLRSLMVDHGSANGRMSWDPMLALMAIIGDENEAGYDVVRGKARLDEATGANYFTPDPDGTHAYVIKKWENARYERMIEDLIASAGA